MYKLEDMKELVKESARATYEFGVGRDNWVLIHYKKGHRGGHHYHKGISPIKNPEVLVLISGKMELLLRNIKTEKEEKITVESPKIIKIDPYVYHEALALEDCIFLEIGEDGYPKDKFELKEN
ncbi:MAG: hypothetical protein WC831_06470 [Parcubacteria group bacterium]|jgi:hypothetical protein